MASTQVSLNSAPVSGRIVRKGYFYRAHDSRRIPRLQCTTCRTKFSSATFSLRYRQKKRKLNSWVRVLLCSGVSQRRIALILGVDPKTVVRKFLFLAAQSRLSPEGYLESLRSRGALVSDVQFDEMETFGRSKCLPLSIPLLVESKTRRILSFGVASMPCGGPLSRISLRK